MFVGQQYSKAEEAMKLYTSLFSKSKIGDTMRYGKMKGRIKREASSTQHLPWKDRNLQLWIAAISMPLRLRKQSPLWSTARRKKKLTCFGEIFPASLRLNNARLAQDRFGVSWQIVPTILSELLGDEDPKKASAAMRAMLQMKKMDIAVLKKAHKGLGL